MRTVPPAGQAFVPHRWNRPTPTGTFEHLDLGLLDWADDMDGHRDGEYGPADVGHDLRGGPDTGVTSGAAYATCSYKKRARLLAWVNGDWG
ncbi:MULTISPECIES: hypothetical protein [Streptomyces]|uniref:hypothetical protein n=1 Tax=Streptomyces TaxID=1883 RepID=UPI001E30B68F|nr:MULTISPECIES: hypothetical protein [Streptomyces]UFQ13823.1 hypothetical protein J2N69_01635 [Streptomyces huasconensis]WCL83420.1 hypothetical protein PPN52_01620 [Streptomyces sp. JCM 35825]